MYVCLIGATLAHIQAEKSKCPKVAFLPKSSGYQWVKVFFLAVLAWGLIISAILRNA